MTPKEIKDIVPVDKVYEDSLRPAMKQIGFALESAAKASRFLLAPLDYLAAQSERWQRYLKRVSEKVDDDNLVEGAPEIIIPTLEGLSLVKENSIICELFINLLSASIDKRKQAYAHPSFPNLIKQLSHDEAVILYFYKAKKVELTYVDVYMHYSKYANDDTITMHRRYSPYISKLRNTLSFPALMHAYLEHLESLNVIKTGNSGGDKIFILSEFGKLFTDACAPETFSQLDEQWRY